MNKPSKSDLARENLLLRREITRLENVIRSLLTDVEKAPTIVQFDRDVLVRKLVSSIDVVPF